MELKILETTALFNLDHTIAGELLSGFQYPWEALAQIKEFILKSGRRSILAPITAPRQASGSQILQKFSLPPTLEVPAS